MITDKLRSYRAAKKKILKTTEHRSHKRLNNRIEASHQATRIREKIMRGFKSPRQARVFLSIFGILRNYFKIGLYKLSALERRRRLRETFEFWNEVDQQPSCA
jgi:putative transposase